MVEAEGLAGLAAAGASRVCTGIQRTGRFVVSPVAFSAPLANLLPGMLCHRR
jgi:hypothetical protein